jgi:opacity protein-like surface antigen
MKNTLLSITLTYGLVSHLYAGGDIVPVEIEPIEEKAYHVSQSDHYIVIKGLYILGEDVNHGHDITLDGDKDYGFGIDIGYRLGHGFAIEYDFSYATSTITETDAHHHTVEADATYYTHALDLVYTYHLTHEYGVFFKAGYIYEKEEIDDLHIDSSDNGFVYGIGVEYMIDEDYAFLVEYEGSSIDGPRGDGIFVGVQYNF